MQFGHASKYRTYSSTQSRSHSKQNIVEEKRKKNRLVQKKKKKIQSSKAGQGEGASIDTRVLHLFQKNPAKKSIHECLNTQS